VDSPKCASNEKNITFDNFLEYTFEDNRNKKIDLLTETSLEDVKSGIKYSDRNNYISYLTNNFIKCYSKSECSYNNVRFHMADARNSSENILMNLTLTLVEAGYNIFECIRYMNNINSGVFAINTAKIYTDQLRQGITILESMLQKPIDYNSYIPKKTIKQINNIKYPEIKVYLQNYLYSEIQKYTHDITKASLDELLSDSKELLNGLITSDKSKIITFGYKVPKNLFKFFLDPAMVFMDVYLIGRIFRQFKDGTECNNCIIYAGNNHCENYEKILLDFGFAKVFETHAKDQGSDKFQCLDLTGLKLPLFS